MARNRFSEVWATLKGFIRLFLMFSSPFIIFGSISLNYVLKGSGGEIFMLGNTAVPTLLGAGATYYNVLFFSIFGCLAMFIGVLLRYLYYKEYIEELRSRGVTDLDEDGEVDSFADGFLDKDL